MHARAAIATVLFFAGTIYVHADSYVYNALVIGDLSCKSGIKLKLLENEDGSGETRCELSDKKIRLYPLIGQTVKVRIEYGHLVFKLKEINPIDAAGSKKQSFGTTLGNVMVAAAGATSATSEVQPTAASQDNSQQSANQVQTPVSAEPPAGSVISDGTNKYTTGVNECVQESHDMSGNAVFHNVCSTRVNVWWAGQAGHGSLTLGPGDQGTGAGSNMSGGAKGSHEYYVCSQHYNAVDQFDHPIVTPIVDFKCMYRGY